MDMTITFQPYDNLPINISVSIETLVNFVVFLFVTEKFSRLETCISSF